MAGGGHSAAALFPLWDVVDDTIVTTRGVYLRGFELVGMESEHVDVSCVTQASKVLYAAAQSDLPEETLLQFVVEASGDYAALFARLAAAPPPADPTLAHQRRRRLEYLRGGNLRRHRLYLFVGSLRGLSLREFAQLSPQDHAARVAAAADLAQGVQAALERTGHIWAHPMGTDALWTLYERALNPDEHESVPRAASPDGALAKNPSPQTLTPREALLRAPLSWDEHFVRLGRRHGKVVTLRELPNPTQFTAMEPFFHLGFDYRLSVNLVVPAQAPHRRALWARLNVANANRAGKLSHVEDAAGTAHFASMQCLSRLLAETRQKVVLVGVQAEIFGRSRHEAEARTQTFCSHLKQYRFRFCEETTAHDRELFKTLPGMAAHFDRWRFATSNNAVDLMPVFSSPQGDRSPAFLVRNHRGELFSFDPMEPQRSNWNAIVLGASGAGKSVFMNMLVTSTMLGGDNAGALTIVDFAGEEKSSYLNVARLFGGKFLPLLAKGRDVALNPFPAPQDACDAHGEVNAETLNFLTVLTDTLVCNTAVDKEAALYRVVVQDAIRDVYRRAGEAAPRYHDLLAVLRGYESRDDLEPGRLRTLVALLDGVLKSPSARLFTRPTNLTPHAFTIFDLFGIDALEESVKQALVFSVCHHIKTTAFRDFNPKFVVLDEVAQLLRQKAMQDLVSELYATARKHRTSIWTVSQKYEEFVTSAVAGTTTANTTTQCFLSHQGAAAMEQLVIDNFSLNPREAAILRGLRTRKGPGGYSEALLRTVVCDQGASARERGIAAKLRIDLSPFDYALATSDPADRQRQQAALAAHPHLPVAEVLDRLAYGKLAVA